MFNLPRGSRFTRFCKLSAQQQQISSKTRSFTAVLCPTQILEEFVSHCEFEVLAGRQPEDRSYLRMVQQDLQQALQEFQDFIRVSQRLRMATIIELFSFFRGVFTWTRIVVHICSRTTKKQASSARHI